MTCNENTRKRGRRGERGRDNSLRGVGIEGGWKERYDGENLWRGKTCHKLIEREIEREWRGRERERDVI
jgi:hypothetical protein